MSFLARTVTPANGVQTLFPISFPFAARADVQVFIYADQAVPGNPVTGWTWVSDGQISFPIPPAPGLFVDARRASKIVELDHTFTGGTLSSAAVTDNDQQLLDLLQEQADQDISLEAQVNDALAELATLSTEMTGQTASLAAIATNLKSVITVDTSFVVRPESQGSIAGDASPAFAAAAAAAALAGGGTVQLSANTTYNLNQVQLPVGVDVDGPPSAVIRLANQVTAVLTSGFTAGVQAKTFTVDNASAFRVGQTVMFANLTTHATSPDDAFSHAGRQISAIVGNSITIAAGPNVEVHAAGDIIATTAHLLRCLGDNTLRGFTVDGNQANNLYAHWITSAMIAQEGDNVRKIGLKFKDTPSDAFLAGGPNGGFIRGSWTLFCRFQNIRNNGCHYGNIKEAYALGNHYKDICMGFLAPVEQGGSGPGGRDGHMDGAWIYSNNVLGGAFIGNYVENSICGVGALGSTGPTNLNDETIVANNSFYNCEKDIEATLGAKRIVFSGNRCKADPTWAAVNGTPALGQTMRWTSHSMVNVSGDTAYGMVEGVTISGNLGRNAIIALDRIRGFAVTGNVLDNRELDQALAVNSLGLFNYTAGTVKGNVVMGGYISLWLQAFAIYAQVAQDTSIEGNLLLWPYLRGVSGALGAGATLTGTIFRNNMVRGDTGAVQADGITLVPQDNVNGWIGVTLLTGLLAESNHINFNIVGGAAWDTTIDPATNVMRAWNRVNGAMELFSSFADDAAAAAGGVAVGGLYRTGSALMQRAA